jgi:ribonuclease HII
MTKRNESALPDRPDRPTLDRELQLIQSGHALIAGIDEAGRGAWAGPVVAAAVILDPAEVSQLDGVNDS